MKNKGIYFLKLDLERVACFGEKATLNLSNAKGDWNRWTVILGDNGTGKTTLLKILAGMEIVKTKYKDGRKKRVNYDPVGIPDDHLIVVEEAFSSPYEGTAKGFINWNIRFDGKERENYIQLDFLGFYNIGSLSYSDADLVSLDCFGYGAARVMGESSINEMVNANAESLLGDDVSLINAEEWLLQLDYADSKFGSKGRASGKRLQMVINFLKEVLPDIEDIRFSKPLKRKIAPRVEFKTPFGWTSIQYLSLGYKTMMAWMVDLMYRLFEKYPESKNPLAEPAIVLIDEIDLHLHPKWQRKIFEHLSTHFPATQFIVTAHSPLIVQSAPADANLVLLRREGDHVVIDQDIDSVRNWRIDQILSSDLFDVPVRNDEVEQLLERRTKLIQKSRLTVKEKAELKSLNLKASRLPYADSKADIDARKIIQEAAAYLKKKNVVKAK